MITNETLLFRMIEQPEKYSDTDWQQVLADADQRRLYEEMSQLKSVLLADHADAGATDETLAIEWQRIEQRKRPFFRKTRCQHKVAAVVALLFLVGGIAWAAVHVIRHTGTSAPTETPLPASLAVVHTDSLTPAVGHKLYDNVELGQMLDELANVYHLHVLYREEQVRQLRLYYRWNADYTVEKVMEMLNTFERIRLQLRHDTLFVESYPQTQP